MEPVVASPVSACGSELSLASTAHDDHDAADFPEGADRGTSHVGKCGVMRRPIQASPDTIPGAGRGGGATPAAELRGVCTITEEEAVIIFLANKADRVKRDRLASRLADEYGITAKAVRDIWSLRTWIRATKPHWTSDDHTRSANKRAPGFARLHRACGRRQEPKQVTRAHSEPATAAVPRPSCRLPSLIKTKPGAVDQAGQVADIDDDLEAMLGWLMPFDVDVAAASLGRARDPSAGAELGEWLQNLLAPRDFIPAPVAVDQGQLGQEARVGQDREEDDDLGWLIPAGIEPGRHQPEHAILSCFRVMNLIP